MVVSTQDRLQRSESRAVVHSDPDRSPTTMTAVLLVGAGIAATVVVVPVMVLDPLVGLAAAFAMSLAAVVIDAPERAAYAYLLLTPILAGFERGTVMPVARPSEALLALLLAAVITRALADGLHGRLRGYRMTHIDFALLTMAVCSSIVPLIWRIGRGYRPTSDDLLFSTTLWKYFLVFAMFRLVITTPNQVLRCLHAMIAVGVVVASIAILQSTGLAGVPELIARIYNEPIGAVDNNRGSATLGTSHGVADIMAFDLALAVGMLVKGVGHPRLLRCAIVLFGFACLASGQFSAILAVVVAVVALGLLTGRLWPMIRVAVPMAIVAVGALQPVVQARLASTNDSGVPSSWDARIFNLTNYFWPELFSGLNWVLGVRPAGRLASYEPWREWVYIESGHTWLLWTGGLPFFFAFMWFSWALFSPARRLAASPGLPGVVGIVTATAIAVVFWVMLLDVHLTMRGPADALFPLAALVSVPAMWATASVRRSVPQTIGAT